MRRIITGVVYGATIALPNGRQKDDFSPQRHKQETLLAPKWLTREHLRPLRLGLEGEAHAGLEPVQRVGGRLEQSAPADRLASLFI